MAEKNTKANRPKSGTAGENDGSSGPRVRYQLPPDESSPRGSPDPQGTAYPTQKWTLKKFNLYGDMPEYNNKWSMFLGFIQTGIGAVAFILGIVLIAISAAGSQSAIGIWGGLIFIGSGLVGVFSFRKPLTPLVIACFGLSAACLVIALIMFIMVCYFANVDDRARLALDDKAKDSIFFGQSRDITRGWEKKRDEQKPKIAVGALLILLAIAEMVVAILQGLLVAKVFVVRGPQAVPSGEKRLSASNPIPDEAAAAGGDQSWGEYNPPARTQQSGDQQWGEYKPERRSRPAEPKAEEEQAPPPQEWKEYKPQKGRKAMREESQKGNISKPVNKKPASTRPASSEVNVETDGKVAYNPNDGQDGAGDPTVPGIIRRQATGTVDVEEEPYCPPLRESYAEDDGDEAPRPISVSVEI